MTERTTMAQPQWSPVVVTGKTQTGPDSAAAHQHAAMEPGRGDREDPELASFLEAVASAAMEPGRGDREDQS